MAEDASTSPRSLLLACEAIDAYATALNTDAPVDVQLRDQVRQAALFLYNNCATTAPQRGAVKTDDTGGPAGTAAASETAGTVGMAEHSSSPLCAVSTRQQEQQMSPTSAGRMDTEEIDSIGDRLQDGIKV